MKPFIILSLFLLAGPAVQPKPGCATLASANPGAKPAPARDLSLRILSDTELPNAFRYAVDVRWPKPDSVFLALKRSGVVEAGLSPAALKAGTIIRQLVPGEKSPGGFWISQHIGASPSYLLDAAPLFTVTWRTLANDLRRSESFEAIFDADVHGNRAAVLGVRRDAAGNFSPDGAIAWLGSLDRNLADLKVLLTDIGGPGAPNGNACGILLLGATRFLADGSLVVVPGIQPGLYRFSPQGKLVQTVDTVTLGIDSDCSSVSQEFGSLMRHEFPRRLAWVNDRRVVDDVIPLPSGPGLLVRSLRNGRVQWELKVLHADGKVTVYRVPVQASSPFAHLKADTRGDQLVLLLWEYAADGTPDAAPRPHLFRASLPGS